MQFPVPRSEVFVMILFNSFVPLLSPTVFLYPAPVFSRRTSRIIPERLGEIREIAVPYFHCDPAYRHSGMPQILLRLLHPAGSHITWDRCSCSTHKKFGDIIL